ncbi:MAG: mismatch-specific DNA-glycosylase [Acidimicrobiia bacterium]
MAVASAPTEVPLRLWELHRATTVGEVVAVDLGEIDDPQRRADLIEGGGFEPAGSTMVRRCRTLADTVGADLALLCVGLNPSLYAADAGVGFARPGNRFWPAALAAGVLTSDRDPRHALVAHRVGMTDLVKRATARADELGRPEFVAGAARLERLCAWLRPRAVCILGLTGWRTATGNPRAAVGWQPTALGGSPVYLMPNPSGLNARVPPSALADHLRTAIGGPPA